MTALINFAMSKLNNHSDNLKIVDPVFVKYISTDYGKFIYSTPLQTYFNVFEQVNEYNFNDVKPDEIVLDIGAFVGVSSLLLSKKCKYVYAVEPLFYNELEENVTLNKSNNIMIIPYALGESEILNFCGRKKHSRGITLSSILNKCIVEPTFLKMDCEGGEWYIQPNELENFRAIEAEIHNFGGKKPITFIKMLEELKFSVKYKITSNGQYSVSARRG